VISGEAWRTFGVCSQPGRHNAISSCEPAELSDAGSWNGGSTKRPVLGIPIFASELAKLLGRALLKTRFALAWSLR
jgi:hypothetical protein